MARTRKVEQRTARGAYPNKSRRGVQVVARAADILRALEGHDQGLSLGQLAERLRLPRSTVQRIVDALDAENFVIAASPTARVRLGSALVRLARSVRFRITEFARPFLEELSRATGETVDLAVLDRAKAVFVDQIPGTHRLRAISAVGVSFPLHCTANGKAILAALDPEVLKQLKKHIPLTPHTKHSVRSWRQLEAELAKVRQTGLAHDREEHALGVSAVGASVTGPDGDIAAISIPVPTMRFAQNERKLISALRRCCLQMNDVLHNRKRRRTG